MKIVKLIICILFGAMFINAGLNKFFNYMPVPELTEAQLKVFGAAAYQYSQFTDCRNSSGEMLVLLLNNLLNDCGYSKPS